MNVKDFYMKHYLKLFAIPILLLLAGAFVVYNTYKETGDIFHKDVSLQGGVSATLYTEQQFDDLEGSLDRKLSTSDVTVRELSEFGTDKQVGILIEATNVNDDELMKAIAEVTGLELNEQNYYSALAKAQKAKNENSGRRRKIGWKYVAERTNQNFGNNRTSRQLSTHYYHIALNSK